MRKADTWGMLRPEELEVFRAQSGPVIAVDETGTIRFANSAALDLVGWGGSLVGRPLVTIIPERLRTRHREGFRRFVETGVSRLQGRTVRVPAVREDGTESLVDLTIRVFQRPDGTRLAAAALSAAPTGAPPPDLLQLETALQRRLYALL